jgi:subtilisin family serine protease
MVEPERYVRAIEIASGATAFGAAPGGPDNGTQGAWGLQTTRVTASRFSGRGVLVAVLDTGIDLQHPDFATRTIVSESFVPGAAIDDGNGHGTYCAGVVCGPTSPAQLPRYGVACDAILYVGKVIGDDGSGTDGTILAGIDWAVRNGCAVVSLSVGSPVAPGEPYSGVYEQAAQRALAAGTLMLAAAGNDSVRPDEIAPVDHPANCPSILAIAAIDEYLRIAPFSCGGVNGDGGEVDLAAPGVAIRSSWPRPDLYRTDSGTSMATPHVAGIAALLAEANPSIRGRDLLALLTQSVQPLSLPARDVGAGLVLAP